MKNKISIIIPVYKVEKYLDSCVESVVNQTYENLEIILVDDGSPDNCPKMCDDWAKKDKRIKVIHKENGGLSDARNAGIDVAPGDYLMFLDSDDSIHTQTCEILLYNIENENADVSACSFQDVYEIDVIEEKKYKLEEIKSKVFKKDDVFDLIFNDNVKTDTMACAKMYKKGIFNELRFDVGKIHEDEFIVHKILNKCEVFVYTDLPLYNYFKRADSITGGFSEKRLMILEALENRISFIEEYRPKFRKKAIYQYLDVCFKIYYKAKMSNINNSTCESIKEKMFNYYKQGYKSFKLIMFFRCPKLLNYIIRMYCKMRKKT